MNKLITAITGVAMLATLCSTVFAESAAPAPVIKNPLAAPFWKTNLAEAEAQAKKEGKTICVLFAGLNFDSIVLKKSLENNEAFKRCLEEEKIIPVLIDCPNTMAEMSAETLGEIKKIFLNNVPTITMMDSEGHVFGIFRNIEQNELDKSNSVSDAIVGFKAGKAAADEMFKRASTKTGLEKAKLLNSGLLLLQSMNGCFDTLGLFGYEAMLDEMAKNDADDNGGFAALVDYKKAALDFVFKIQTDPAAAQAIMDTVIAKWPKDIKAVQCALTLKAKAYSLAQDVKNVLACLSAVIAVDPETNEGKQAAKIKDLIMKKLAEEQKEARPEDRDMQQLDN